MMPRIRLKGKPYQDCFVHVGSRMWEFRGGEVTEVPQHVVDVCLPMKTRNGAPMFELLDEPDSDVEHVLGIQLEFKNCL